MHNRKDDHITLFIRDEIKKKNIYLFCEYKSSTQC